MKPTSLVFALLALVTAATASPLIRLHTAKSYGAIGLKVAPGNQQTLL